MATPLKASAKRVSQTELQHSRPPVKLQMTGFSPGVVEDKWLFERTIGSGTYGIVHRAVHKETGEKSAIKELDKRLVNPKHLETEVQILQRVNHPNVIALKELYQTETKLYIVMEYAAGGTLVNRIRSRSSYDELDVALIIRQLLSAIDHLHNQGIVHRDLKPDNILLESEADDARIKLADFGLSKILTNTAAMRTTCGSPTYIAPEILDAARSSSKTYDKAVDLWSIGVTTYVLLSGHRPFYGPDKATIFRKILRAEYSFPSKYWALVSEDAKQFICGLLQRDPEKRLTVADCLAHPWIQQSYARIGEEHSPQLLMLSRDIAAGLPVLAVTPPVPAAAAAVTSDGDDPVEAALRDLERAKESLEPATNSEHNGHTHPSSTGPASAQTDLPSVEDFVLRRTTLPSRSLIVRIATAHNLLAAEAEREALTKTASAKEKRKSNAREKEYFAVVSFMGRHFKTRSVKCALNDPRWDREYKVGAFLPESDVVVLEIGEKKTLRKRVLYRATLKLLHYAAPKQYKVSVQLLPQPVKGRPAPGLFTLPELEVELDVGELRSNRLAAVATAVHISSGG